MADVVDIDKARLKVIIHRGFRNWKSRFAEQFGPETTLSSISIKTLAVLASGKDESTFYLFDLIMILNQWGSGFEFHELKSEDKMAVMDQYLFLLDRIRFEYMKRLGWLAHFPGEEYPLVELILHFNALAPLLQADTPKMGRDHPQYERFLKMKPEEQNEFIRKMIPDVIKAIKDHSTTL